MNTIYWSGCNYWINRGKNEHEPIGTATSMHECDFCERLSYCTIKKIEPVWDHNSGIEFEMTLKWNEMIEKEKLMKGAIND